MTFNYVLFTDGGCYTRQDKKSTTPAYFSYKLWTWTGLQSFYNGRNGKPIAYIEHFYLRNLVDPRKVRNTMYNMIGQPVSIEYDETIFLPPNCSIYDPKGKETNNIAEYVAVFYGLQKAVTYSGTIQVISDSQIVLNQLTNKIACNTPHLSCWRDATLKLIKNRSIDFLHVRREYIVKMLGH